MTAALATTTNAVHAPDRPPALVICDVFGARHCYDALRVAWCESRFHTTARNGQFLGVFQMGAWERRRFGHGTTVLEQARAARRYFRTAGGWGPWTCRNTLR